MYIRNGLVDHDDRYFIGYDHWYDIRHDSPLIMKGVKLIRQRRKVDRILREILQEQRNSPK
jgi:hypothetical protein